MTITSSLKLTPTANGCGWTMPSTVGFRTPLWDGSWGSAHEPQRSQQATDRRSSGEAASRVRKIPLCQHRVYRLVLAIPGAAFIGGGANREEQACSTFIE